MHGSTLARLLQSPPAQNLANLGPLPQILLERRKARLRCFGDLALVVCVDRDGGRGGGNRERGEVGGFVEKEVGEDDEGGILQTSERSVR